VPYYQWIAEKLIRITSMYSRLFPIDGIDLGDFSLNIGRIWIVGL